ADEAELVNVFCHAGIELADPGSRLTVLGELELARRQHSPAGTSLAVALLQLGLVLERVHLGHRPFHEQEDDPLGLHRKMRLFGSERAGFRRRFLSRRHAVLAKHSSQGEHSKAAAGGFEKIAAGRTELREFANHDFHHHFKYRYSAVPSSAWHKLAHAAVFASRASTFSSFTAPSLRSMSSGLSGGFGLFASVALSAVFSAAAAAATWAAASFAAACASCSSLYAPS